MFVGTLIGESLETIINTPNLTSFWNFQGNLLSVSLSWIHTDNSYFWLENPAHHFKNFNFKKSDFLERPRR